MNGATGNSVEMKRVFALLATAQLLITGSVAFAPESSAQTGAASYGSVRTVSVESWVEEWDAAQGRWVRVADAGGGDDAHALPTFTTTIVNGELVSETSSQPREAARYAQPAIASNAPRVLAQYGPFVVTGPNVAALVGGTDGQSPLHFDAMLRDFPELARLEMVEAPGTSNDLANLEVGRMIRAAGIATHVPSGGSVRSGAVELFLAGTTRTLEDGAQFAVHSWLDNYGREADDFSADHAAHRLYLDYYVEMGMSENRARAFYDMTNSVPHSSALWLKADDMRPWLEPDQAPLQLASREIDAYLLWDEVSGQQPRYFVESEEEAAPELTYSDLSDVSIAMLDPSRIDSPAAFP